MNIAKSIYELKRKLVEAVNESKLPASVAELIVGGIHAELLQLVAKELSERNEEDGTISGEK